MHARHNWIAGAVYWHFCTMPVGEGRLLVSPESVLAMPTQTSRRWPPSISTPASAPRFKKNSP